MGRTDKIIFSGETLLITSKGAAAEYQGHRLGYYEYLGEHEDRPYFSQLHTLPSDGDHNFIHYFNINKSDGWWGVGPRVGLNIFRT